MPPYIWIIYRLFQNWSTTASQDEGKYQHLRWSNFTNKTNHLSLLKDISQRFESAQNQILLKASQAPQLCTGVTIGPHASSFEDQSYFGVLHDERSSQPEPIEKPKDNLQMDTNDSAPNTYPVSAAKALQELDDLRKAEVKVSF